MRIALLADIHGNLLALQSVLRDLRAAAPDLVINLGDHASGPLWAAATIDLLIDQASWVHIRGNHDRQVVDLPAGQMGKSDRAAVQQLAPHHLAWLAALPPTAQPAPGLFLCHGTPDCDTEYLIEDVSTGFARPATPAAIRARIGSRTGVIVCGHSHVPRFVRVDAATIVLNPGSVGLQAYHDPEHRHPHSIEVGSPHARYLLLDHFESRYEATLRVIEYDWEHAAREAEIGLRPDWAHALRTGYAHAR